MKSFLKLFSFVLLSTFIVSCSTEENETISLNENASINTLRELVKSQTNINSGKKTYFKKSNLTEAEAEIMLEPIINETVSVLINSGISEDEIVSEFGSLKSPEIVLMSVALLSETNENKNTYAKGGDVLDCAARAFVGIELHEGFWKSFTNRRVLMKAVGKLATRALGFVGAALVAYDFADCMWG